MKMIASKNIVIVVSIILIASGLMLASGVAGYKWKAADYAETVAALNKKIYDQGVELQNAENNTGELNRQLKIANRGRIDAIKINDHSNNRVKNLQAKLNVAVSELENVRDQYNYIVVDVTSIKRVYDQSRDECDGLPGSNDPTLVPSRLSEFTGDSVTGVVRDIVGRYCSVATDYNSLYTTCETLLAGKKKPGD